jgi:hypothetical protein
MRAFFVSILTFAFALIPAQTQAQDDGDKSYLRALATVQTLAELGGLYKDWCDERVPDSAPAHEAALNAWRAASSLDEIDARAAAALKSATSTTSKRRADFYAKLDRAYNDPAAACGNLKKNLLSDFNPQKMYPDEYKLALSRPREGAAQQDAPAAAGDTPSARQAAAAEDAKPAQRAAAVPASIPDSKIAVDQLRAAPGKGIKTADVLGIIHHGEGKLTVSGYKFVETVGPVLLKNGKAYARAGPPEGLDVEKSHKLEPQTWGEWRERGDGYEVRWRDGAWKAIKGTLRKPFAPGTKLNAAYENLNYEGSVALGGMAFRKTYVFKPDGQFELIGFSQGSAGSVAADGGFTSSSTTTSSGKGTSTVSSSSSTNPADIPATSAPAVVVDSSSTKGDGADHRGSYRLNGYTLEITFDSGRKMQILALPWGEKIVLGGKTYSRPEKR